MNHWKQYCVFFFWVTLEPPVPQWTETFPSFKPRSEITCCYFSPISVLPQQVRLHLHGREGALLTRMKLIKVTGTARQDFWQSTFKWDSEIKCDLWNHTKTQTTLSCICSHYVHLFSCYPFSWKTTEILAQSRSLRLRFRCSKAC